jgi:hypothetical protein
MAGGLSNLRQGESEDRFGIVHRQAHGTGMPSRLRIAPAYLCHRTPPGSTLPTASIHRCRLFSAGYALLKVQPYLKFSNRHKLRQNNRGSWGRPRDFAGKSVAKRQVRWDYSGNVRDSVYNPPVGQLTARVQVREIQVARSPKRPCHVWLATYTVLNY